MELFKITLAILVTVISSCQTANILYAVPFSSKSHYIMLKPIGLELAKRGHNVTVIAGHKEKNPPPNYRQIMIDDKEIWEVIGGGRPNVFKMAEMTAEQFHEVILWGANLPFTEMALNSTEVQQFLAEDNHFDVVIAEQFFQEAFNILAHKYNAPLVFVTTYGNCMRHNIVTRNPLQLATTISEFLDVANPTSFLGRLRNLYFTVYEYVWWKYWFLEENEKLVKKYVKNLPQPVPSLFDVQRDAALLLVNGHFSFDNPIAYLPNIVEVGGVHITKSDSKLPNDLQEILDSSTQGVVYVNFGSNVRSSELPLEKKNAFLKVFRELKETVVWKWEDDNMENKPRNLVLRKWLPQKEILAHPNVKVFISHGGLIGTQESIYSGVPIIGIPIYADQYNNLLQAEQHGFGKILRYTDINEDNLRNIVSEVLNDHSYKEKALTASNRFKDRPLPPLETAMFWIEYVIRNKGADFIKNPARNLSWIAYNMLDVYAFIIVLILAAIYLVIKVITLIAHAVFASESKTKGNKKKRQ